MVLNGFEDYANDDTEVALAGSISIESGDYAIRETVDLCNAVSGYNVDGDYCPGDGTYELSASFELPGGGGWWGTGFGASGDFEVVAHDGTLIGSCFMTFATPVHSMIGVSSKITFITFVSILGVSLFAVVFLVFRKQVRAAQRLRRMRYRDDDSTFTKGMDDQTAKTGVTDYTNTNDDQTADESGTYDNGTYDDTISYDPSSVWTGTTVHSTVEGTVNHTFEKAWKLGELLVDRVVNGKPLRTPPAQQQESRVMEDTSLTSYSTVSDFRRMKDATETGNSKQSSTAAHNDAENEYRQMEEDSMELTAAVSSDSSIGLNCDSMDVQATDRRAVSRYACGANDTAADVAPATDVIHGVRTAAEKVQAMGKGFVDKAVAEANWLLDEDSEVPKIAPPQKTKEVEVREDGYHNMNVYTVGLGESAQYSGSELVRDGRPASISSSKSDDSSREDVGPDTSSITPAAPRRQTVRFNFASLAGRPRPEQDKRTMLPKSSLKKGLASSDSVSVHAVMHGHEVRAGGKHSTEAKQQRAGTGSFVPWNEQAQWKRRDKWTAASLNQHAEL